ncbi:hypothetical protein CJ203_00480 [Corynebacterium tuscaniense]|uniref:DUF3618 domain-containing protein n=1 Tax=Corynebacterium tuscaniense TaxID=302449 RepID=A0A2N6T7V2_9CORY|nr:DUF3618 domain-containing protein [Corynebacterium tuscaniense]KAA8736095.1 DUF3618 domain-containing protein [Corynebacterium tuscaniense]PMC65395.1 hypothetical protein CJ203_00480 [Corynebacterium tuscaniense]
MARDINDIQREIERTRVNLASTIDEIADRTRPENLANNAKAQVSGKLKDDKVQKVLAGVAVAVVLLVALKSSSNRKKKKDLKELQRLLAERN